MSEHAPSSSNPSGHPPDEPTHGVRSEEDVVPVATLVKVGVAALLIFFLGSLAAVGYLHYREVERGPIAIPPEIGQSKIGLVEQQQFTMSLRGDRSRAQEVERLGSLGWVDRNAGVAHIPIEDAMRLVVQGVRPEPTSGAPPPGGQP